MKKIKNIKQLRAEKIRIKQQQLEIEEKLRLSWKDLKEFARPGNIARDAIGSIFRKKTSETQPENKLLDTALNVGLAFLTGTLTEKVVQKIRRVFTKSRTSS